MRKLVTVAFLIVVFLFFMTGAALALEIKFAHVVNEKDAFHVAAEKFKELVEKNSKGEITVAYVSQRQAGRRTDSFGTDEDGHRRFGNHHHRPDHQFCPFLRGHRPALPFPRPGSRL